MRTSNVTVAAFTEDSVLLIKPKARAGGYGLPSGKIKRGEPPEQAAMRELKKQTGLKTSAASLQPMTKVLKGEGAVFAATGLTGDPRPSTAVEPEWVPIEMLGEYDLLPGVKEIVYDILENMRR